MEKSYFKYEKKCKEGGFILITTRSKGFHYHGYPYDFWRFEIDDMRNIFQDCEILALEKDSSAPGVFIKAKKMNNFNEIDLSSYALYSIILNRKVKDIEEKDLKSVYFKFNFKLVVFKTFQKIARMVN